MVSMSAPTPAASESARKPRPRPPALPAYHWPVLGPKYSARKPRAWTPLFGPTPSATAPAAVTPNQSPTAIAGLFSLAGCVVTGCVMPGCAARVSKRVAGSRRGPNACVLHPTSAMPSLTTQTIVADPQVSATNVARNERRVPCRARSACAMRFSDEKRSALHTQRGSQRLRMPAWGRTRLDEVSATAEHIGCGANGGPSLH